MQIACPQCSMKYALDTRLLPPGGVPVQCTRCSHVFIAATPGQTAPQSVRPLAPNGNPNPNSTLIFGSSKSASPPSAQTTQVFGAVPQVPAIAPVANQPQPAARPPPTADKPQAGASPVQTTQVFGAVPKVPPGGKQPTPSTAVSATQVFGAVPQVPPSAKAPVGTPPSASTTQVFGAVPVPGPRAAPVRGPQQPGPGVAPGPGMTQVQPAPQPFVGVAEGTPIELPEDVLEELNRPLTERMAEGESHDDAPSQPRGLPPELASLPGNSGSSLPKPPELPPGLLADAADSGGKQRGGKRSELGPGGRGLLIAAVVLVLGLTAFLTSPAWRTKSNAVPHEVLVAKEEAVASLRRDDKAAKEEALSRLRMLSASHPDNVELLVEVGITLALHMDDTRVQVTTLQSKVKQLQAEISTLSEARSPADWPSRVNQKREELAAAQRELTPLEERGTRLTQDALQVLKQLAVAPEKEAKESTLARMRARGMLNGALGADEALDLARRLAQSQQRDWSTLVLAEYVLNTATPSPTQVAEAASALERMREADKTFLRTYMLEARIALLREQPATALPLLDTVLTLNPKHELAQALQAYAQELVHKQDEPTPTPAP